jgi:hypothetical protein
MPVGQILYDVNFLYLKIGHERVKKLIFCANCQNNILSTTVFLNYFVSKKSLQFLKQCKIHNFLDPYLPFLRRKNFTLSLGLKSYFIAVFLRLIFSVKVLKIYIWPRGAAFSNVLLIYENKKKMYKSGI